MKRFFIYVLILLIGVLSAGSLLAQVGMKKVAQSTMNFLQVGVVPAASSMGDAYTAVGTGCESIFFNPAGLPEMESRFDVMAATTQWFADINYMVGALAWNMGNFGTVGVSFVAVDYGDIIWTGLAESPDDEAGYVEYGMIDNTGAYAVGLSYGRRITNKFSIGGNVRYVAQHLGESYLASGKKKNSESNVVKITKKWRKS